MQREFLVMKFACQACGSKLSLSYDKPKPGRGYSEGEPTGAAMVEQCVVVEPCKKCFEPMEKLKHAIATMIQAAG